MDSLNPDRVSDLQALVDLFGDLEGSLLEVYVFGADRVIWRKAIGVLARYTSTIEIDVAGQHVDLKEFDDVQFEGEATRVLRAFVDGVEWTSTLFREDQVDLQLAPEDFAEPHQAAGLLGFLQDLADSTGKTAVLVAETVRPEEATPLASAHPS